MREIMLEHGDCMELMRQIPDACVDLVVTDPPYRITSGGCTTKGCMALSGVLAQNTKAVRSGKMFEHNDIAFSDWVPEVFRILKPNTHCYIMTNSRNLLELWSVCEKAGFVFQNLLVWEKGNVTPNRYYMGAYELVLMLRKGKAKTINHRGTKNILRVHNQVGRKNHPTEKPMELMQIMVENSTQAGDLVFDPFMGTGSTGVACVRTGRRFWGAEISDEYFREANRRIKETEEIAV